MKIVINKCYGGFSLSPKAIKRYAELKGIPCFLFSYSYGEKKHILIDENEANQIGFWVAYKIENPDELINFEYKKEDLPEGMDESSLEAWEAQQLKKAMEASLQNDEALIDAVINPEINRTDLELIQTVEELGLEASGSFSSLAVVEIPDDTDWLLVSNAGIEHIAEKHRTWE
jgi:hypothetical protein